jgi:hypothetical protein
MALLDLKIELHKTNELLERIALALERAYPNYEPYWEAKGKRGPDAIVSYGDDRKSWARQEVTRYVQEQGLSPAQSKIQIEKLLQEAEQAHLWDDLTGPPDV